MSDILLPDDHLMFHGRHGRDTAGGAKLVAGVKQSKPVAARNALWLCLL